MNLTLDYQADILIKKTKHYLITTMGRIIDEANADELYRAISYALREEIMINWLATWKTLLQKDVRILYYLSMEYLPGRIFTQNISNISSLDVVRLVLHKLKRDFKVLINRELDPGLGNESHETSTVLIEIPDPLCSLRQTTKKRGTCQ